MYIKKDATLPTLTVAKPEGTSEDTPTLADSSTYTVSGTATDMNGITSVTVNGNNVTPDTNGAWSYEMALEKNVLTTVTVVAENSLGKKVTVTRYVRYNYIENDTAPELTVTTPTATTAETPAVVKNNDSFKDSSTSGVSGLTGVTGAATNYTVTGTVTDNEGVTSVTVNGKDATIASDGSWSATVTLKANEVTPITVVATDTSGKTTTKTEYVNYRIYQDTDNNSNTINFVNFEEDFSAKYKGTISTGTLQYKSEHALNGVHNYSIYSGNHSTSDDERMRFFLAPEDVGTITDDGSLVMQIYSEKATNAKIQVLLWCQSKSTGASANQLYLKSIPIDWTGEKIIEFSLSEMKNQYINAYADKIYYIEVATNKGFSSGAVGNAETELYIQDMYIKKDDATPNLTVSAPAGSTSITPIYTQEENFTVCGTVSSNFNVIQSLTVNGVAVTVEADGTWSTVIQVPTDGTVVPIEVVATDNAGNTITQMEYVCYGVQYTLNFINFEDADIISKYNYTKFGKTEASAEHTADDHTYSVHWYNHGTSSVASEGNTRLQFALETGKMTMDSALKMKIYSEKANNAFVQMIFYCPNTAGGSLRYFSRGFNVNWEGEKEFTFLFSKMGEVNSPDWSQVYRVEFIASGGWDIVGKADTDLYISDAYIQLYVPKNDYIGTLENLYEEEDILKTLDVLKDSVAFYAGGTHVATDNGATDTTLMGQMDLGGTVGYVNDTVMIPISVFETYFGATTTIDGGNFSITIGEKTFSGTVDQTSYSFGDASDMLSVAPYVEKDVIYVPGAEVAALFGIPVCADGEFLLMGTEDAVNAVKRKGGIGVNLIQEIASYLSYYTEQDLAAFTDADFEKLLDNWARRLVGNETINSSSDSYVQELIKGNEEAAEEALNLFRGINGHTSTSLFKNTEITTTFAMSTTYNYIRNMALGYATCGTKYYQNEELYEIIKYCLEWMTDNYYRIDYTWQPTGKNDWFDWDISTPSKIIDIMVIMRDKFSVDEMLDYLNYFEVRYRKPISTGSNFADFCVQILGSGALQKDAERAMVGLRAFEKMYLYVDDNERLTESFLDEERAAYTQIKGAGFFTDGSYVYHTLHPMNHTYGAVHFENLCLMESLTAGTVFEINSPQRDNLVEFFFNNLDSTVFDGTKSFLMFMGRDIQSNERTIGTGIYGHMLECADNFSEKTAEEIYAAIKGAYEASPDSNWSKYLTFDTAERFSALIADDTVEASTERNWNKVYYNQDTIVHLKEDWAVGIKMSSSRIFNYESINSQNLKGWYLSDGRTEYFIKGNDTGSTPVYWSKINMYRLPGTTVDTQERQSVSVDQGNEYLSSKDFVGGTTLNGIYGTAAMELESYHADKPIDSNSDGKGANPVHTNDLTAKKGYFMFDNSIICLGTDVNASNNNNAEVLTIVENKMANGTVNMGGGINPISYEIVGVVANAEPQPANPAIHTIDGDGTTKWAAQAPAEIVWDLGEVKEMGFAGFSFLVTNGRKQYFDLYVSTNNPDNPDEITWEKVNGDTRLETSGKDLKTEYFSLGNKQARYLKFAHLGTSIDSLWISLAECDIYPMNPDGSIGVKEDEIYGSDIVVVDGQEIELLGEDYNLNDATWVNVADECGYYFFANDTSATSTLGDLKARWTNSESSFFELWYSHGVNPNNGSYAYALLPGMTAAETAQYAENIPVQVLANNSSVQAVYNGALGITGIIFWEAGTFGKITVDKPCIVMYEDNHAGFNIAVTDPTQKLESLIVTVAEELNLVSADECASVLSTAALSEGTTTIALDTLDSVGRTFEVSLVKAGHSLTKTEAKAADCTTDGNITYWTCDTCEKFFADEKGITEITLADTVIEEKGHSYKDGVCEVCGAPNPDAEEDTDSSEDSEKDESSDSSDEKDNDTSTESSEEEKADEISADPEQMIASTEAPTGDNTSLTWIYLLAASAVILILYMFRKKRG